MAKKDKKAAAEDAAPSGPAADAAAAGDATRRKSCRRWRRSSAATIRMALPRLEKIVVNMGVGSAVAGKEAHGRRRRRR